MKHLIFVLVALFAFPLVAANEKQKMKYARDYKQAHIMLDDFMDLSKKPNEPIKYWAAQLFIMLSSQEKLAPFFTELSKIIPYKNARRIAFLFIMHRTCFPKELQELVLSRDILKIYAALEKRVVI